jgi:hypothetical protein
MTSQFHDKLFCSKVRETVITNSINYAIYAGNFLSYMEEIVKNIKNNPAYPEYMFTVCEFLSMRVPVYLQGLQILEILGKNP